MPITPVEITSAIVAAGPNLKGPAWFQLSSAIGIGVFGWSVVPTNVILTGLTVGTVGGGQVTGKLTVPPIALPVVGSLYLSGMVGVSSPQVATAVGVGIGTAYSATGAYTGQSIGAVGSDVSKVVFADAQTLTATLIASMASNGLNGPKAKRLAAGLAPGIAAMFLTGFGTGVSVGPGGPMAGTGLSKSSIF